MGMRLSDPREFRGQCWGASILESARGEHKAEPGERYCRRCRKLVEQRRLAAASAGASGRDGTATIPAPTQGGAG